MGVLLELIVPYSKYSGTNAHAMQKIIFSCASEWVGIYYIYTAQNLLFQRIAFSPLDYQKTHNEYLSHGGNAHT